MRMRNSFVGAAFVVGLLLMLIIGRSIWKQKLENGYVAFNSSEYKEANRELTLVAYLGDSKAQQLMSYMSGLGLGQPVDFADALYWMRKGASTTSNSNSIGEQAYYLGASAKAGTYGEEKKEIGLIWLKIAYFTCAGNQASGTNAPCPIEAETDIGSSQTSEQ
jgi:TPR repeat protein